MAHIAAARPATVRLSSIAKECRLALVGDRHKHDLGVGRLVNAAPAVAIAARINQFGSSPIDSSVPVSFSQTDPSRFEANLAAPLLVTKRRTPSR